jgi:hypothetical protein
MSPHPGSGPDPGSGDDPPPRPLLGLGFWLILILSLVCVLAGVAIATLAPRLLRPAAATSAQALGERHESR